MKTTVVIPDALLAEVQAIAARNKTTLRALMQEGLMLVVERDRMKKKPFKLEDCSVGDPNAPWPLEGKSWDEILELAYGDRG